MVLVFDVHLSCEKLLQLQFQKYGKAINMTLVEMLLY